MTDRCAANAAALWMKLLSAAWAAVQRIAFPKTESTNVPAAVSAVLFSL
jgi:hypothetical protein